MTGGEDKKQRGTEKDLLPCLFIGKKGSGCVVIPWKECVVDFYSHIVAFAQKHNKDISLPPPFPSYQVAMVVHGHKIRRTNCLDHDTQHRSSNRQLQHHDRSKVQKSERGLQGLANSRLDFRGETRDNEMAMPISQPVAESWAVTSVPPPFMLSFFFFFFAESSKKRKAE